MTLKSNDLSRTETYSYLNRVAPALLRPYLKHVMEQSCSSAAQPVKARPNARKK